MKKQGYPVGTEVKWTDESTEGFRTGIVRAKYYDPDSAEINGEQIEITVIDCSPTYDIKDKTSNRVIVVNHTKVTLKPRDEQE